MRQQCHLIVIESVCMCLNVKERLAALLLFAGSKTSLLWGTVELRRVG